MANKSASPTYKHASHVAWRRVEKEAVILDLDTSAYYSLSDVGVLIWERLGNKEPLEQIRDAVCDEYEVSPEEALRDIKALVKKLTDKGLLLAA